MTVLHKHVAMLAASLAGLWYLQRRASARRSRRARSGEVFVSEGQIGAFFDCRRSGAMTSCIDLSDCAGDQCREVDPARCASLLGDRPSSSECDFLTGISWQQ